MLIKLLKALLLTLHGKTHRTNCSSYAKNPTRYNCGTYWRNRNALIHPHQTIHAEPTHMHINAKACAHIQCPIVRQYSLIPRGPSMGGIWKVAVQKVHL
jgi:hypothetical protein